jgi:glycosyltransferase involved in cell wall biosynthesis
VKKLISVVSPAYNESSNVDELARRIRAVFDDELAGKYDFECIIVENGSADDTYEKLLAIRERDHRFKILQLSRNFGIEGAITSGLRRATGDAAVIMCADLQDPPEVLPRFIERWEQGFQNVYGVITKRTDEGRTRRFLTRGFYWLINKMSDRPVPSNVSDFRLLDRVVYTAVNRFPERNRMFRAVWAWVGFRSTGVEHERPPRTGGQSTYGLVRNIRFALTGIMASSITPLKIIPIFGLALSGLSFISMPILTTVWLLYGVPFAGFGTIVSLILMLFGLLFLFLGIMSEYIGLIFDEVRRRPGFIVSAECGFGDVLRDERSACSAYPYLGE